jgi:hypothetical protein
MHSIVRVRLQELANGSLFRRKVPVECYDDADLDLIRSEEKEDGEETDFEHGDEHEKTYWALGRDTLVNEIYYWRVNNAAEANTETSIWKFESGADPLTTSQTRTVTRVLWLHHCRTARPLTDSAGLARVSESCR